MRTILNILSNEDHPQQTLRRWGQKDI